MSTRFNSSETTSSVLKKQVVIKDGKISIAEDHGSVTNNEITRPPVNNTILCTIQENKTASDDVDKSSDTIYEEDSSNGKQKLEIVDDSFRLYSDSSPVLTIIDPDHLSFSKKRLVPKTKEDPSDCMLGNVYGNSAFEEHSSDVTGDSMGNNQNMQETEAAAANIKIKTRRLSSEKKLVV